VEKRIAIAATLLAVLFAPALVVILTGGQLAVSYDSLAYLGLAESIRAGDGFVLPFTIPQYDHPVPLEAGEVVTHWAPGYPLLLALLLPMPIAAFSAAISVALAAVMTRIVLGNWRWHSPAAAWMVALSPAFVVTHLYAWSEPPFITLMLVCAVSIAALERTGQLRWVAVAATAAAASFLVRYLGIAILAAVILAAISHPWESTGNRVRAVVISLSSGLVASAIILLLYGDSFVDNAATVAAADEVPGLWSAAARMTVALPELLGAGEWRVGIGLALPILLTWIFAPVRDEPKFSWPFIAAAIYLLALLLAHVGVASIPFDLRLLAPVGTLSTVGVVVLFARRGGPLPPVALGVVSFIWILAVSQVTLYSSDEAWVVAGCADGGPARICEVLEPIQDGAAG
jgi:hypothetical protein